MPKAKTKHKATLLGGVKFVDGWVLVSREKDHLGKWGPWYIAWPEIFSRKADALKFATDNKWPVPFRAVRGSLSAAP